VYIVTTWTRKDEPRELRKVDKTRIFSVTSAVFNIVLRAYFLPIIELCAKQRGASEVAAGINATSPEWDEMARGLRQFAKFMMGDMEAYDSSHTCWGFLALAKVFAKLAKLLGFSGDDVVVIQNLVLSCMLQVVEFDGILFLINTGLASGLAVTTLFNSVMLALLFRMVYHSVFSGGVLRDHVYSRFYGDDSVNSVSEIAARVFSQKVVGAHVAKWGYRYTSALKDGSDNEFERFEDLQFLKRGIAPHRRVNMFVAPLATKSFVKALCWRLSDAKVGDLERLAQVVPVIWREAWLHDHATFQKWDGILRGIDSTLHLNCRFPSEDELALSYAEGNLIGWYD
jgi:hypothetical protein